VKNLDSYSADFHGRSQPGNLGLNRTYPGLFASLFYIGRLFDVLFDRSPPALPTDAAFSDSADARALTLFRRNLKNILALSRAQGVRPVLIPHLLNENSRTSEGSYGWIPYVRDKDLPRLLSTYNRTLIEVASEHDEISLDAVQRAEFQPVDFTDQGHFSSRGNRKFATIVATALMDAGVVRTKNRD
jgi:hypothetical protein